MADKELNALIDTVAKSKAPNEKKVEQIREQIKMREMVRLRRDQVGIGLGIGTLNFWSEIVFSPSR